MRHNAAAVARAFSDLHAGEWVWRSPMPANRATWASKACRAPRRRHMSGV
jgi:hypothetical protein